MWTFPYVSFASALTLLAAGRGPAPAAQQSAPIQAPAAPESTPSDRKPTLTYEETFRGVKGGIDVVTYLFSASGFPPEKSYAMGGKRMDGSTGTIGKGLHIAESGRVLASDGSDLALDLGNTFAGESIVIALASEDRATQAFVEIIPNPIHAEGKGGCRLQVRPMDPKGLTFSITGSGFKPNKKLKMTSSCSNEVAHGSLDGRPDGSVKAVVFAGVVGRTGGDASYSVADSDCSATVRYKWGDEMTNFKPPPPKPTPAR
jgi:hypothetical protein